MFSRFATMPVSVHQNCYASAQKITNECARAITNRSCIGQSISDNKHQSLLCFVSILFHKLSPVHQFVVSGTSTLTAHQRIQPIEGHFSAIEIGD